MLLPPDFSLWSESQQREGGWVGGEFLRYMTCPRIRLQTFWSLTTDGDVTELHPDAFVQGEAPGGFVFVPRVTAVGVTPVQLRVAHRQEGVAVWVLGVPRLTLTT